MALLVNSDNYVIVLSIVAVILSAVWWMRTSLSWRYRLPPGPINFPILGILPFLDKNNPGVGLLKMSKRYGKVFFGYMGSHPAVFLADYDLMKETFSKSDDSFNDRPRISFIEIYSRGQGVACCFIDNQWREQRRFTLRALRNHGMGRGQGVVSSAIVCEVNHALDEFARTTEPLDPSYLLSMVICNITCKLVFGRRYDYDDEEYLELIRRLHRVFELSDPAGIVNYVNFLKYVPFSGYKALWDSSRHLERGLFAKQITDHKMTFDPDQEPRDMIDSFLLEMSKKEQDNLGNNNNNGKMSTTGFNNSQMVHFVGDLFAAGTDTTGTSLRWSLSHVAKYVDEQKKVQEELDRVVGRDRLPTLDDKPNLPYTQAFLAESLRNGQIGHLGVPHSTYRDTKLNGYDVPKGTIVFNNLYAVLHDPETFPTPHQFNPGQFLDEHGDVKLSMVERVNAQFGVGRRMCVGKDLALMERYLFMTSVLHRFSFTAVGGPDSISTDGIGGLTRTPHPYKLIVKAR